MPKILARLKTLILNLLFPIECLGCGHEGLWLCPDCSRRLRAGDNGKSGDQTSANRLKAPALDKIYIAGDYNDVLLANMIKKFKYNFITALGKPLADFLSFYWSGQLALAHILDSKNTPRNTIMVMDTPLVMPVPLSEKRRRWRGFNQAEILAREFAASFSYSFSTELKRTKHRRPQASLNEAERLKNLSGAFEYEGASLAGRTIILIDDIVTTGATLNEAALALRAQGAKIIYGLVLAKG